MENTKTVVTGIEGTSSMVHVNAMRFFSETFDGMFQAYIHAQENYHKLDLSQYSDEVLEMINIRKHRLSIVEQILNEEIAIYISSPTEWIPSSKLNSFSHIMDPPHGFNPKIGRGPATPRHSSVN